MKHANGHKLGARLLSLLLLLCLLAPSAASAGALIAPRNLYDTIQAKGDTEIYVISEKEFVVLVQKPPESGSQMLPEKDMKVTVTTQATYRTKAATVTKTTTDKGMAVFNVDDFRTEEHIKETRYFYADVSITDGTSASRQTWHDPEARLIAGQKKKVVLAQSGKDPYIYEATMNGQDVLMSDFKAQISEKNDAVQDMKVIVSRGSTQATDVTCKLKSGDKVLGTQSGKFDGTSGKATLSFKGKWLNTTGGFTIGQPVSLVFTVGREETVKLSVTAVKPPIPQPQSNMNKPIDLGFSISGGALKLTIPSRIPFIGGLSVTIKIPNMPITFYLDTTGKFLLGAVFTYSKEPFNKDDNKWKQTNPMKVDDWLNEQVEKFKKDRQKIKDKVTPIKGCLGSTPWMPKFELEFSIGAMFKSDNIFAKKESNVVVGASTFASIGGTLSVRKYFMAGPVPIFIGGALKGSIKAAYDYKIIINQGDPLKTMRNKGKTPTPVDLSAEFEMSASLGVSVTAGVGIEKFICVWAEGSVTALPAITFAVQTKPEKPYPHYVFKLNFCLRAGVRIIFKEFEITPLNYNYVIADNHDPKDKPYFEKISGPWAPNPTGSDDAIIESSITAEELEQICIGSVTFDTELYGDDPGDSFQLPDLAITLSAEHASAILGTNLAPFENDAIPYDDQLGDETWTAGTSDGLGIVTPDMKTVLQKQGYGDPKLKVIKCHKLWLVFFIAVVDVNDVKLPTLVYGTLDSNGRLNDNKVTPILYGTESKDKPRYVTDFDVSLNYFDDSKYHVEPVIAYATVQNPADKDVQGQMGIYVRPFTLHYDKDWALVLEYLAFRKELRHGWGRDQYSVLMPKILLTENMKGENIDKPVTIKKWQVCVAYLLQWTYGYKGNRSYVMMYARNADGDWCDDAIQVTGNLESRTTYPITQIYIGTGEYLKRDYDLLMENSTWRVAYVYKYGKPLEDAPHYVYSTFYVTDFYNSKKTEGANGGSTYTTEFKGTNLQRFSNYRLMYINENGNLSSCYHVFNYETGENKEVVLATDITLPHEGESFFVHEGNKLNFFYYWPEKIRNPGGSPEPLPKPLPDYQYLMGRMISIELENDGEWAPFTGKYRKTSPFILCKLDLNIDYLRAFEPWDAKTAYCGLFYTSTDDPTKFVSDVNFARVPIVDAIEVPSLSPGDPCIGQGEVFRMYVNIENAGNTFLGAGKLQFVYKNKSGSTNKQEKPVNLLDCDKIMASEHEFDFSELGVDEMYIKDHDMTLAETMKDPLTSKYFDDVAFADDSDEGYSKDQVALKYYAPGDVHTYAIDGCMIPKNWAGTVVIQGNGIGAERRSPWQSGYTAPSADAMVSLTAEEVASGKLYKEVPEGGYFAFTSGASATGGYSDIVLEGDLITVGDAQYLELNLRNETTNPANAVLRIYGDDTLLLEKEFKNIASGVLDIYSGDGYTALNQRESYFNGLITEGYDPSTSTGQNGYINLTFPVSELTQGLPFYKLSAVLEASADFETIEDDRTDNVEFVIQKGDPLQFVKEPVGLSLKQGQSGVMKATFTGGIGPYDIAWQKKNPAGVWKDVYVTQVSVPINARSTWSPFIATALAEGDIFETTMTFSKVTTAQAGTYRVVVTDKSGQWIASKGVPLAVKPPHTGDAFPTALLLAALGASLTGITWLALSRRRRNTITR